MKFKHFIKLPLVWFILLSSINAIAEPVRQAEVNTICPGCSTSQMEATAYMLISFDPRYSLEGDYTVNVLNTKDFGVESFLFHKGTANDPSKTHIAGKVPTRIEVVNASLKLKMAIRKIESSVSAESIPTSVVSDAWGFVNCAYCAHRVENFMRQNADIKRSVTTIDDVLKSLNITAAGMFDVYEVPLLAGGKIYFTLGVTNTLKVTDTGNLLVEITEVIDEGSNKVPFRAKDLNKSSVWIISEEHAKKINARITNFELYIPVARGRVTITDIPDGFCKSLNQQSIENDYPWCEMGL